MVRIGVDVGGTFTDCVVVDERGRLVAHRKEPSSPPNVEEAALAAIEGLSLREGVERVVHGTTVATNALIERTTARTGLLTTEGFRDVLAIGTQSRPDLYDVMQRKPEPLVPRELRLEVPERIGADGRVVRPLDEAAVRRAARRFARAGVEAVSVCFLFSYVDARHERRAAAIVREELGGVDVALSSEVAPLFREYPRTSTTVLNAALRPVVGRYLRGFAARAGADVLVLDSAGGVLPARRAAEQAHRLLLSGPAAGVVGATAFAVAAGARDAVTMDMGGTSFDTCLVLDAHPTVRPESEAAGHPVLASAVDLVTVGAGGGSIAAVDRGGALIVGPRSAGARPGPACYGLGGLEPTVTDANLVAGRLDPDAFLEGRLPLDPEAAERAIHDRVAVPLGLSVERAASAILEVATATMARVLRVVTVGRGRDPADLPLVAFGGAGPLAAAALAEEMASPSVLVPPLPGFVSAIGLLATELRTEVARTVLRPGRPAPSAARLGRAVAAMAGEGSRRLGRPPSTTVSLAVDCRYEGQGYELTVPLDAADGRGLAQAALAFHRAHDAVFGHAAPDEPVEVVALRVTVAAAERAFAPQRLPRRAAREPSPSAARKVFDGAGWIETPVFDRPELPAGWSGVGPLLVAEGESTTWIPAGWRVDVDAFGTLVVARGGAGG